jgi:hypothetical protein
MGVEIGLVEPEECTRVFRLTPYYLTCREAGDLMDLARPELRPLIDLRSKPNYHAPSYHDEELDLVHASVPPQGSSPLAGDGRISTH